MWDDICKSRPVVLSMSELTHNKQARPYHIRRQGKLQIGWNAGDVSLLVSCGGHLPIGYSTLAPSKVWLADGPWWCPSMKYNSYVALCICVIAVEKDIGIYTKYKYIIAM